MKDEIFRSTIYTNWVKTLGCSCCGSSADDPHHVIGLKLGLGGMGTKAPCSFTMPLCRSCHQAVHGSPELQRLQPEWLEDTWRKALWHFGPESEVGQQITGARRHMRAQLGEVAA